jgi:host factor-I protein
MDTNLLDSMLNGYRDRKTPVTFVLQNRTRVSGMVRAFDNYVIILEGPTSEIIYRHAVSSLSPAGAADAPRPAPQRAEQPKPAPRPSPQPPPRPRQKPDKAPPRAAAAPAPAEQNINTGMKEGLMRWMQEQKASK